MFAFGRPMDGAGSGSTVMLDAVPCEVSYSRHLAATNAHISDSRVTARISGTATAGTNTPFSGACHNAVVAVVLGPGRSVASRSLVVDAQPAATTHKTSTATLNKSTTETLRHECINGHRTGLTTP